MTVWVLYEWGDLVGVYATADSAKRNAGGHSSPPDAPNAAENRALAEEIQESIRWEEYSTSGNPNGGNWTGYTPEGADRFEIYEEEVRP